MGCNCGNKTRRVWSTAEAKARREDAVSGRTNAIVRRRVVAKPDIQESTPQMVDSIMELPEPIVSSSE